MKWYGISTIASLPRKDIKNYKRRRNIKIKSLSFYIKSRLNLNPFQVFFYLPNAWSFVKLRHYRNNKSFSTFYLYSKIYYFYLPAPLIFSNMGYDKFTNTLFFNFKYRNNFFNIYWVILKNIFFSFSRIFFKKLKFKGKGYYIYKNYRNTIAMQFGYSHRVRIYSYFLFVKFLTKTSILLFGLNKEDIIRTGFSLYRIKPINIFTGKGIRFTRQIVYKKTGKVSSYR